MAPMTKFQQSNTLSRPSVAAGPKLQGLFGRDEEAACLLDALERIHGGAGELVFLPGSTGAGKTSLANVLCEPVQKQNGFFLTGKFNQFDQNTTFTAWREALASCCQTIIASGEPAVWQERFQSAVGRNGDLLLQLVPEFTEIIGAQPPVDAISSQEARHRFASLIRDVLGVICRPESPTVIFIDDWQWADPASLYLLEQLELDSTLRYVAVVCAYRDDEISASHPLALTLDYLRHQGIPAQTIPIEALSKDDVERLLASQSIRSDSQTAAQFQRVSKGNAFFVTTLIRQINSGVFDPRDLSAWPQTVTEAFQLELSHLNQQTRDLLCIAACLGHSFSLKTLAQTSSHSVESCEHHLRTVSHLVAPTSDGSGASDELVFQFIHDQVQQAAHSQISHEGMPELRLRIAEQLLQGMETGHVGSSAADVASHFNAGAAAITSVEHRLKSFEANVEAGRRAQSATAFASALQYYRFAELQLEDEEVFRTLMDTRPKLLFDLALKHAETEFLEGDPIGSEAITRRAVALAATPEQRAEALSTLIVHRTLQARYQDAIVAGREALAELNVVLPDETDFDLVRNVELEKITKRLRSLTADDVLEMPNAEDIRVKTIIKVLITMGPPCYRADQQLWSIIVPRVVSLTLEHGGTPEIGYSHTGIAGLLAWVAGDFASSRKCYDIAIRYMAHPNPSVTSSHSSVFRLMVGSSCRHWFAHLRHSIEDYDAAVEAGRQSGNMQYAAYAFAHKMYCRFFAGAQIEELMRESAAALQFSRTRHNQWAIDMIAGGMQVLSQLAPAPTNLQEQDGCAARFVEDVESRHNHQVSCVFHVMNTQRYLIMGDIDAAWRCCRAAEELINTIGTQGLLPWVEHHWMAMLLTLIRSDGTAMDHVHFAASRERLATWADLCPENFAHKLSLIDAEAARLRGDVLGAASKFDRAIVQAKESGFTQWEGLANERAASLWEQSGDVRLEYQFWEAAFECYSLWGAATKTQAMESQYRQKLQATLTRQGNQDARQLQDYIELRTRSLYGRVAIASDARESERLSRSTRELEAATNSLRVDLADRKRAAEKLRVQRDEQEALAEELRNSVARQSDRLVRRGHDLKTARNELMRSSAIMRTLMDESVNIIGVADPKGVLLDINETSISLAGSEGHEFLNKVLWETPWWSHSTELQQKVKDAVRVAANGKTVYFDASYQDKNGNLKYFDFSLTPVLDKTGNTICLIPEGRDVTEHKAHAIRLEELLEKVQQSNRELEQFAYVASHDLQEPLRKISAYCQLVKEDQGERLDEDGHEFLDVAINSAKRLQDLIKGLLSFSRIATHDEQLDRVCSDDALHLAIENLQCVIQEKDAKISATSLPDVVGDSGQLTCLFQNLIGNAIKYCRAARPVVEVSHREVGEDVIIAFKDNGVGIDSQFFDRIFQVFQRLHSRHEYEGTGIGLAICRRIVERFGGKIWVESVVGEGSTFFLQLPVHLPRRGV